MSGSNARFDLIATELVTDGRFLEIAYLAVDEVSPGRGMTLLGERASRVANRDCISWAGTSGASTDSRKTRRGWGSEFSLMKIGCFMEDSKSKPTVP